MAQSEYRPASESRSWLHSARVALGELMESGRDGLVHVRDAIGYEMRQPTTAAALAGGAAVGLGLLFGVAPTALAAGAAYVTYRILRREALH